MIVKKALSIKSIFEFAGHHLIWLTLWMSAIVALYHFTHWEFVALPFSPIMLIGTAVALFVGFKDNQAYDRLWEGRRIWGDITSNSRKLGTLIKNLQSEDDTAHFGMEVRKEIVFRHIAYLYQFREELLEPTPWEYMCLDGRIGKLNRKRHEKILLDFKKDLTEIKERHYLSDEETENLNGYNNKAAQLLNKQAERLQFLFEQKAISPAQQATIQGVLNGFHDEQGNAERIKKFPLPRKYAHLTFVLVCIFVFILPFGIISEFGKWDRAMLWMSIPVGVIVGWIFIVMELIGDYSENPFEGLHNDVPMLAICREIEIDLLQMIDEKDIPKPIQPKHDTLF